MKKAVFIFIHCLFFLTVVKPAIAQEISGIWRGYFITDDGDQYKYEVQLGQSKKASLTGVTYSYLDTRFYGKATFTGMYAKGSATALVQEIKTVELKMANGSIACIMKCKLTYTRSGKEEFLEGPYTSIYEKTDPSNRIKRGASCGGGNVFLRKVTTSDFYVEPFLRNKKTPVEPVNDPPLVKSKPLNTTKKPIAKPVAKRPVIKEKPLVKRPELNKPILIDSAKATPVNPIVTTAKPIQRLSIPTTIRDRKNELAKTINVSSREVLISLYDNGEIDDDSISVYLDDHLIIANKRLSHTPITYTLKLSPASPEHTLTMYADNLGRIPPNTSLMIIQDGDKRYQVSITSTEQKNAMVRFRYEGQNP